MKHLIHRYLNENYYIKGNSFHSNSNPWISPSYLLVKELYTIFGLEKKELKWYVKSWVKKQSKSFDFRNWWTPIIKTGIYFPLARQINSRLISSDLVSVQPMDMPTGLIYAPYIPIDVTPIPINNFRPSGTVSSRYATRMIDNRFYSQIGISSGGINEPLIGELHHPERPITDMMEQWTKLVNER